MGRGTVGSATGTLIATLSPGVHADPTLLHEAQQGQAATASIPNPPGTPLTLTPNPGFIGTFVVTVTVTDEHGASDSETFQVTVNLPPVLAPIGNQAIPSEPAVTNITLSATDPELDPLTFGASAETQEFTLDQQLNLDAFSPGQYFENLYGQGEKWLVGNLNNFGNPWYIILPSGAFLEWDGTANSATGTLLATLSPATHANPALLHDALPGQAQASVSTSGKTLTITPNPGFTGTFVATVTVTDNHGASDSETFQVTVTSAIMAHVASTFPATNLPLSLMAPRELATFLDFASVTTVATGESVIHVPDRRLVRDSDRLSQVINMAETSDRLLELEAVLLDITEEVHTRRGTQNNRDLVFGNLLDSKL